MPAPATENGQQKGFVIKKKVAKAPLTAEEKEKARMASHLPKNNQEAKYMVGHSDHKEHLPKGLMAPQHTLYFSKCHTSEYTVETRCAKILIEGCHDCTVHIKGQVMSQTMDVWNCSNITLNVETKIKTYQVDMSKGVAINFSTPDDMGRIVWAGLHDLRVTVGAITSEGNSESPSPLLSMHTGIQAVIGDYPDLDEKITQFIVRILDGKLLCEKVIRLTNGYPTTLREKEEYEKEHTPDWNSLSEEQLNNFIKFAAPQCGIEGIKKKNAERIGRNDPCPCESGLKWKKCTCDKYHTTTSLDA